jgi:hypothetical protein
MSSRLVSKTSKTGFLVFRHVNIGMSFLLMVLPVGFAAAAATGTVQAASGIKGLQGLYRIPFVLSIHDFRGFLFCYQEE